MTKGVPGWVLLYALLLAVFGIGVGALELIDPGAFLSLDTSVGNNAVTARGWGGRNLALGIAAALAIVLRERSALAVVFASAIAREVADVFTAITEDQDLADVLLPAVMLAIDAVAFIAVIGNTISTRRQSKAGDRGGDADTPTMGTAPADIDLTGTDDFTIR